MENRVLMIQRAERFSPNSVGKDKAILEAVADKLRQRGCDIRMIQESPEHPETADMPDVILTMGRLPETLAWLKSLDVRVINSPQGVENCARSRLQTIMERIGTPIPPKDGSDGYWLKRGDAAAQTKDDVVFAANKEQLEARICEMEQRGITDYTVSAHVVGDLVKFYGVVGAGFFRCYYPTDDRQTKFGDEMRNGEAHHYAFDRDDLQREAERLAAAVGVEVYGGDCIVREDGSYCIIDFNDWPSFSRCREEASEAIAYLVKHQ